MESDAVRRNAIWYIRIPFGGKQMKAAALAMMFGVMLFGAAPDDIEKSSQKGWYDAVDIDADGDYTNNPSNNAPVGSWKDKSGNSKNVSIMAIVV